jgi:hypothetical protein
VEDIQTPEKEGTAGTIPGGHRPIKQKGEEESYSPPPTLEKKERTNQSMKRTEMMTASSNVISEKTPNSEGEGKDDSQGGKYKC